MKKKKRNKKNTYTLQISTGITVKYQIDHDDQEIHVVCELAVIPLEGKFMM